MTKKEQFKHAFGFLCISTCESRKNENKLKMFNFILLIVRMVKCWPINEESSTKIITLRPRYIMMHYKLNDFFCEYKLYLCYLWKNNSYSWLLHVTSDHDVMFVELIKAHECLSMYNITLILLLFLESKSKKCIIICQWVRQDY